MTATELLRNLGTGSGIDEAFTRQQNTSDSDIFTNRVAQLATGIPTAINRGVGAVVPQYKDSRVYDAVDYLWGEEHDQRTALTEQTRADEALLGGLGRGSGVELMADMVMFGVPTSRIGSMANTRRFLNSGSQSLRGLAKAGAKDGAFNMATFAPTDYALSKGYGLSDGEALINAVSAGAIGGLGSPVVSGILGRKVIGKAMQNALDKTANLTPNLSKQARPEIYVDGHYFPDEKIKQLKDYDVGETPMRTGTDVPPDKAQIPSDDVIKENLAKPDAEKYKILSDPTHPQHDQLLQKEIFSELGYRRITEEDISKASGAKADMLRGMRDRQSKFGPRTLSETYRVNPEMDLRKLSDNPDVRKEVGMKGKGDSPFRDKFAKQGLVDYARRIIRDPKAKEIYRQSIAEKYKPKRSDPVSKKPLSLDEAIIVNQGGEPDVVRVGSKVKRDMVKPKEVKPTVTAKPMRGSEIPLTDKLRNITESQARMAKMAETAKRRRIPKAPPEMQTANIKKVDSKPEWGERTRRPGWDEATIKVMQDDSTKLGTERVYDGPKLPERIRPEQIGETARARKEALKKKDTFDEADFDYKRKLVELQKIASERGYNKVKKSGKVWTGSQIDDFVKNNVPEEARSAYKNAMQKASDEIAKANMVKNASMRKAPKIAPEKVKAVDEAIAKVKAKKEPKPTGAKPGDVQKKIDARKPTVDEKIDADYEKIIKRVEEGKAELNELGEKVKSMEKPVTFKLKRAEKMGYVPEHTKAVYNAISKEYGDIKVTVTHNLKSPNTGKTTGGYYDPDTNQIFVNADRLAREGDRGLIHEALHAVSWHKLREDPKLAKSLQEMMEQAQSWYKKNKPEVTKNYAFKNLDEFFAESMSNPGLMRDLKKIPYENQTIWEKIKSFVAGLFGADNPSLYAKINRTMEEMVEPPMGVKVQRKLREISKSTKDIEVSVGDMKMKLGISSLADSLDKSITSWRASYAPGQAFREFRKLNASTRKALDDSARYKDKVKRYIEEVYKETGHSHGDAFDDGFTTSVLRTDYRAIKEFRNKADAMEFLKANKDIYKKTKKYVDQTAKGMRDRGDMNSPRFSNNAYQIAQRSGLEPNTENIAIIDKLVSIKAMSDADWSFVKKYADTPELESMMLLADQMKAQTDDLFSSQPWMSQKGYISELYEGIYTYKLVDNEWVKELDLDPGNVQGALPQQLDASRIGRKEGIPFKNMSAKMKEMYAETENLGLILDRDGNPVAFRKVVNEAQRFAMGKSNSAMDTIALTMENNVRKISQENGVNQLIRKMAKDGNELFSKEKKEGFVGLTDDEMNMLPRFVREEVVYVKPEFKQMLVGNKELQLFKSGALRVTERVLKDMVQHFKENVVLKNPASWANNTMFAFFMNAQEGIPAKETFKLMKEGLTEKRVAEETLYKLFKMDLKGKTGSPQYKKLQKSLEENLFYQFDKNGLAVTVMNNVLDMPNQQIRFTDKAVKTAFDNQLGADSPVFDMLSNLYIHPASKTGRMAMTAFGSIDSMSRYSLAKAHMNKLLKGKRTKIGDIEWNKAMNEGIVKANSVYGDMDMITPQWSQAIQQYGFIPFSNWFFRVSGGLNKSVQDNMMRALGVYGLLELISDETGYRTESWNPLAAVYKTPLEMIEMTPYNRPVNALKATTMPSVYRKSYYASKYGDPQSVIITENF